MNDLRAVLQDATAHLQGDPAKAHQAWAAAARRRRRRTTTLVLGAAASVALVVGLATWAPLRATDQGPAPQPTPAPTSPPTSGLTPSPSGGPETEVEADEPRIDPRYDPADWEDLPEYPVDLGYWLSPDQPRPLAELPLERATVALSFFLGPEEANLSVIGEDGEWRSIDTAGLTFADQSEYEVGLSIRSLSPDGTRLALGQPDGVVVIDLRTAERTSYPVPGLGELWAGRETSWTSDGSAVLLARFYGATSDPDDGDVLAYQPGFRVDVATGAVSRLDYDPGHAAQLADGTAVANLWRESEGHRIVAFGQDGSPTEWEHLRPYLGAPESFSGHGTRWAIRRESPGTPDVLDGRSGFLVFDGDQPLAMLPVEGVQNNGGGGRVLGWLDESTLLVGMPGDEVPEREGFIERTVAWDVETGEVWRATEVLSNSRVSVAPQP